MARLLSRLRDFGIAGLPTSLLTWSQRVCEQVEAAFASQQDQITAIAALQATQTAQLAEIIAAQTAADIVHRNDAISGSWLAPNTVLSASDAGASATVTIDNHARAYGDGVVANVTGASVTGLSYSTEYHFYYDDTSRVGGAVTILHTTDPNEAANNAVAGRHYIGSITTPAALAAPTTGIGSKPPGYTGVGNIPTP